ncbi:AsnC family transcriptional regulator [Acidimicrobiaceae bacterium USS-CC1]|uniref:AsnC family transcriptional regulator n=1 Tax=Acidiferrimicrobium australe TaxID=2664430 RepID=A0ABW9QZR1_9ACTN|nr:AsnC family transcriptional regulator [Acidiferrimicrobium australe]
MDDVDRELVRLLVADARLTYQQLAQAVHLSANSTADRVRRLRSGGVIAGYRAELDLARLGRTLVAVTDVKLKEAEGRLRFESDLEEVPAVLGAVHTTGEYDYQLRIASTGTADLESVLDALRRLGASEGRSAPPGCRRWAGGSPWRSR